MTTLVVQDFTSFVFASNDDIKTTSLLVAEKFGKPHKDVLAKIRNLDCSEDFERRNFSLVEYDYINNKGFTVKQPMYEMTKDGFMFLVMGFTGKAAAQIKEAYINAFNLMHDKLFPKTPYALKELPPTLETLHVQLQEYFEIFREQEFYDINSYRRKLTPVQSKQINARIDELVTQQIGTSRDDLIFSIHRKIWSTIGTPDARRGQPLTDSRYYYKKICEFLKIEPISDEATERHDFLTWLFTQHPDFAEKIIMQEPRVQVAGVFDYKEFINAIDEINSNENCPFAIVNKKNLKGIKKLAGQLF